MLSIFKQPYPYVRNWKHHLRVSVSISIFVTLFLLLFKPFGLESYANAGIYGRIAGYGLVTFITMLLVYVAMRTAMPHPDEDRWTTGKEILAQLVYIFVLGFGNVIYTHYVFGLHFSVQAFVDFQFFTLLIGIFPVSFFVLANHLKLLHRNEKAAAILTAEISKQRDDSSDRLPSTEGNGTKFRLTSENEKEELEISIDDLVLIESADNYSTVYYLQQGKMQSKLLRSSLKRLEQQAKHENLLRCHRTYLVNLQKVMAVTGNAQGYRLRFNGFDQTFPVSRTLNETIRERLNHLA